MTEQSIPTKRCYSCKAVKPLSDYRRNRRNPDGVASECRECGKAMNASYYQRNKKKVLVASKAYKITHRERYKTIERAYYKQNQQKIKERSNARYWAKRNEILIQQRERRQNNLPMFHERERQRYWRLRPILRERALRFYRTHKQKWQTWGSAKRSADRNAQGSFTAEQLVDKFTYFGWRCYLCKEPLTPQTAQTDHRFALSRGGTNWIANIAPACTWCNRHKYNKSEKEFRQWLLVHK
jgi:5-methylcytosine-specific restriction endonuclease McrA